MTWSVGRRIQSAQRNEYEFIFDFVPSFEMRRAAAGVSVAAAKPQERTTT
jgi:hypothetical protein